MSKQDKIAEQPSAPADVDKVRDILFGGHMRASEERFIALERMVETHTTQLRETLEHRLKELETALHEQMGRLEQGLVDERDVRNEAIQALRSGQREMADALHAQGAELKEALGRESERLSSVKVGRQDLATLLGEVATRLGDQSSVDQKG